MEGIERLSAADYPEAVCLWDASVRATHDFLRPGDVEGIKAQMEIAYLPSVALYGIRTDGRLQAFVGVGEEKIEMLFARPQAFGQGQGKRLVRYAVERLGAVLVDVNEQNTRAVEFYRRQGFRVVSRDAVDGQGREYPILHLRLINEKTMDNAPKGHK